MRSFVTHAVVLLFDDHSHEHHNRDCQGEDEPVTFRLLQLIKEQDLTGEQALMEIANEIQHPDTGAIVAFGFTILTDLAIKQAIIGSHSSFD